MSTFDAFSTIEVNSEDPEASASSRRFSILALTSLVRLHPWHPRTFGLIELGKTRDAKVAKRTGTDRPRAG